MNHVFTIESIGARMCRKSGDFESVSPMKTQNDPYVWIVVDKLNAAISDMSCEQLQLRWLDHFPSTGL